MREIELDLFSLTHPRVVADDDDDGRASILIVFLSFFSLYSFPPFFSPPTFFQSSAAPATFFSLSFFPFILCPYPSSSPWWSPRCHYTNSTTGTTHSRSACVSRESSSIVRTVPRPRAEMTDGFFFLVGWASISYYNLHRPENYFISSSAPLFLLLAFYCGPSILLRGRDFHLFVANFSLPPRTR